MSFTVVRLSICSSEASLARVKEGDKVLLDLSTLNDEVKGLMKDKYTKWKSYQLSASQLESLHRAIKAGVASVGYYIPATWCHSKEEVDSMNRSIDTSQFLKAWSTNNKNLGAKVVGAKFIKGLNEPKVSY